MNNFIRKSFDLITKCSKLRVLMGLRERATARSNNRPRYYINVKANKNILANKQAKLTSRSLILQPSEDYNPACEDYNDTAYAAIITDSFLFF